MLKLTGLVCLLLLFGCTSPKQITSNTQKVADTEPSVITGQCHCGNIKYSARGPAQKCSYCKCSGCQKATGTFKAPFVTVSSKVFATTSGELSSFKSASGKDCDAHGSWKFCPKCGSPVAWMSNDGKQVDIFAGTLDDTSIFQIDKE